MSIVRVNGSNLGLSRDEVKEGEGSPTPVAEEKIIKSTEKVDTKTKITKASMMPITEKGEEPGEQPELENRTSITKTIPDPVKANVKIADYTEKDEEPSSESAKSETDHIGSDMAVSSSTKLTSCLLRVVDVLTKLMTNDPEDDKFIKRRNEIIMEEIQSAGIETSVMISVMEQPYGNILAEAIVDQIQDKLKHKQSVDTKNPLYRHAIASYYELDRSMSIAKLNMAIDVAFKILAK